MHGDAYMYIYFALGLHSYIIPPKLTRNPAGIGSRHLFGPANRRVT